IRFSCDFPRLFRIYKGRQIFAIRQKKSTFVRHKQVQDTMRKILFLIAALGSAAPLAAQTAGRIHRTEAAPYDTRHDAEARNRKGDGAYIPFAPKPVSAGGEAVNAAQTIDIPYAWTD